MPSRYDRIHDEFFPGGGGKPGTRYERLAAVVFKILDEAAVVVHDRKMIGETSVSHQIDIVIERNGERRRILIECKDFDLRDAKVGLGIVRDFWGVVDDVKPDEAYIVTCAGFTKDARKYANGKGIKLAVLRDFGKEDHEGFFDKIQLQLIFNWPEDVHGTLELASTELRDKMMGDLTAEGLSTAGIEAGTPVYLEHKGQRGQFNEMIRKLVDYPMKEDPGERTQLVAAEAGTCLEVGSRGKIPLKSISLKYMIAREEREVMIGGDRIARLLLQTEEMGDIVIWDSDLKRFRFDEESHAAGEQTGED